MTNAGRKPKTTPKCIRGCPWLCHEGLADIEHPGQPCYGKTQESLDAEIDDESRPSA